jgi:hypothetical protein
MATNLLMMGNIYPGSGMSIGRMANGQAGGTAEQVEMSAKAEPVQAAAASIGGQANPLIGLLVFGGLTAGVMLAAHKVGEPRGFKNIQASAYNILVVSLIAVVGIPVWKYLLTRFPVPGVSTWVQAV